MRELRPFGRVTACFSWHQRTLATVARQGGLHHRTGTREPGLTGGVSRADQAAELRKQPPAPAQPSGAAPWSFVGHGGLAIAFAVAAVLLAVAPEKASPTAQGSAVQGGASTCESVPQKLPLPAGGRDGLSEEHHAGRAD